MLSCVICVITLEWSTGKMKFDACPVEPPGLGSGPFVDQDDLLPAMPGQMIGDAIPHNTRSDNDDSCMTRDDAHQITLLFRLERPASVTGPGPSERAPLRPGPISRHETQ